MSDGTVRRVHFPHSGAFGRRIECRRIETAMVGRDGVLDAASALDGKVSLNEGPTSTWTVSVPSPTPVQLSARSSSGTSNFCSRNRHGRRHSLLPNHRLHAADGVGCQGSAAVKITKKMCGLAAGFGAEALAMTSSLWPDPASSRRCPYDVNNPSTETIDGTKCRWVRCGLGYSGRGEVVTGVTSDGPRAVAGGFSGIASLSFPGRLNSRLLQDARHGGSSHTTPCG
jgi:hypothetical protein